MTELPQQQILEKIANSIERLDDAINKLVSNDLVINEKFNAINSQLSGHAGEIAKLLALFEQLRTELYQVNYYIAGNKVKTESHEGNWKLLISLGITIFLLILNLVIEAFKGGFNGLQ